MEQIILNLRITDESSQRELTRYRELGTVESLAFIKGRKHRRLKGLRLAVKAMERLFYLLCIATLSWMIISWADVVIHNSNPNPIYQSWNLFTLFF